MSNCSEHGNCTGPNSCTCENGYKSTGCSQVTCELVNYCSDRGVCSGPNICTCDSGYKGVNCSQVSCEALNDCSSQGNCTGPNICTCEKGFRGGPDCSKVSCELLNHCSNHGNCSGPNVCSCHDGFKGMSCSEVTCQTLNNCSNHGLCVGPNECTCARGYHGADCSEEPSEVEGKRSLALGKSVGISTGIFMMVLVLSLTLLYWYMKRKIRRLIAPIGTEGKELCNNPEDPTTAWPPTPDLKQGSKTKARQTNTLPLYTFNNPAYSKDPLEGKDDDDDGLKEED